MPKPKAANICVRLPPEVDLAFRKRVRKEHDASVSHVIRELIVAFIEDRINVEPITKEFLK